MNMKPALVRLFDVIKAADKNTVTAIAKRLFNALEVEIEEEGEIWIVQRPKIKQIGRYLYDRELRMIEGELAACDTVSEIKVKINESTALWEWTILAINDHVMAHGSEGTWLNAVNAAQKAMQSF